jgi:acyl carrier protein
MTEIENRIYLILVALSALPMEEIAPTSSLSLDLDLDSLELADLAQIIEDEFALRVADEEMERVQTVEQLCELVEEKVSAAK